MMKNCHLTPLCILVSPLLYVNTTLTWPSTHTHSVNSAAGAYTSRSGCNFGLTNGVKKMSLYRTLVYIILNYSIMASKSQNFIK